MSLSEFERRLALTSLIRINTDAKSQPNLGDISIMAYATFLRHFQSVFAAVLCAVAGLAQAQLPPAVVAKEVAPGAYYVEGLSALGSSANLNFISNAGFVVTPQGVVVVDALGSPVLAQRLLAQIKQITSQPVTHVIVTHYHADHIYGLQTFKAAGARIVAHRKALDYIHSDAARLRIESSRQDLAPWIDAHTRVLLADEWLDGDKTLELGGVTFQIKAVGPAHTPEDLVVYVASKKLLFAGDLVFRNRVPFVGQADSRRWILALDQLLAFDATSIVPGHGPVSMQARADMELTRDYLKFLRAAMGQAARNMEPFDEAYKSTDWSRFEKLPLFQVANRMNAYNTYLLLEREAP